MNERRRISGSSTACAQQPQRHDVQLEVVSCLGVGRELDAVVTHVIEILAPRDVADVLALCDKCVTGQIHADLAVTAAFVKSEVRGRSLRRDVLEEE